MDWAEERAREIMSGDPDQGAYWLEVVTEIAQALREERGKKEFFKELVGRLGDQSTNENRYRAALKNIQIKVHELEKAGYPSLYPEWVDKIVKEALDE
jgi:hypothetical protein